MTGRGEMSESSKGIDWKAISQRFHDHNQQLLRDNAELLRGPTAKAIWPNRENEKMEKTKNE
jgi:hypothetical protein